MLKIKTILFALIFVSLYACQVTDVDKIIEEENTLSPEARATLAYLIAEGHSAENLIPNNKLGGFEWDDLIYPYELAGNLEKQKLSDNGPKAENQWNNQFVAYSNSRSVKYYIRSSFPSIYIGALNWAAYYWSISSPNISMSRTYNQSEADIICEAYYTPGGGGWAYATFPNGNGNVGSYLGVNTAQPHDQSSVGKMVLMMHELGHTLGFRHSDNSAGYNIPNTQNASYHSGNTCGSIMRSSVYDCGWGYNAVKRWSTADRAMIDWAYTYY